MPSGRSKTPTNRPVCLCMGGREWLLRAPCIFSFICHIAFKSKVENVCRAVKCGARGSRARTKKGEHTKERKKPRDDLFVCVKNPPDEDRVSRRSGEISHIFFFFAPLSNFWNGCCFSEKCVYMASGCCHRATGKWEDDSCEEEEETYLFPLIGIMDTQTLASIFRVNIRKKSWISTGLYPYP